MTHKPNELDDNGLAEIPLDSVPSADDLTYVPGTSYWRAAIVPLVAVICLFVITFTTIFGWKQGGPVGAGVGAVTGLAITFWVAYHT